MEKELTCGELIVRLLEGYGVDTVFGIPGVHTLELYRGLTTSAIRHILPRHEQGAGFMADGYARISGKPGVCFLITGPGLTNAATAIGQAFSDSVPMLVITSVNERATLGKGLGRLHECDDQKAITAPITAFSATAMSAAEIPGLLAKAFAVFAGSRPRPVHIEIPLDVLDEAVPVALAEDCRSLPARPVAAPDEIEAAAGILSKAERPLIIAGGGALEAATPLKSIAEKTGAALFTTIAGKGIIPDDHPLHGGATLCLPMVWDYVADADVILAIGTELAETDFWRDELPITGKIIRVDIDAAKLVDLYPAAVAIQADAARTAAQLDLALPPAEQPASDSTAAHDLISLRHSLKETYEPLQQTHIKVLEAVRAGLPENSFIATDMTQIAYTGNYAWPVSGTRQWLHPTGYGTLGYALPAAIGGAVAAPGQVAVALAGDGGVLYTLPELASAREHLDSPLILLIWNNHALGQIRDDMVARGIQEIAVTPKAPDFQTLAAGFGVAARRPDSLDQLTGEIAEAAARPGVTVIEITQACAG